MTTAISTLTEPAAGSAVGARRTRRILEGAAFVAVWVGVAHQPAAGTRR
jgi:hypothetical protein